MSTVHADTLQDTAAAKKQGMRRRTFLGSAAASGSLVVGLALLEEAVLPEDAFAIAHLDELWQAEQWGEDEWALDARNARKRDFLAACQFLELL